MFRRILIIFGYILAGFVIAGGTFTLVAYGQGYTYDFGHHRFVHRGLILFGSVPSGAYITQDGVYTKHHTGRRDSYNPGSYSFKVDKPGYNAWTKTLTVEAGMVVDARYIILPPLNLIKTTVATVTTSFSTPATSTDHRQIAYSSAPTATDGAAVWTQALPGGKAMKRYSLPAATPTTPAETIIGLQWSGDSAHLLVISQAATGRVYRVINADGTDPINLTDQYKLDFTGLQSLQFAPSDWHDLFWIGADGSLRRLDLNAQTVSNVLATQVSQFSYAGDRVLYVNTTSLGQSMMALQVHNPTQTTRLVQSLPKSPNYTIVYANYQGTDELVVIPSATHEATVYSGIFGSSPVSTVVARNVDNASFAADGHLVALYSPSYLVTYDLELSTPTDIINYTSPSVGAPLNSLTWFDDYHLVLHLGGQTVFSDFDGTNRVILGSAVDGSTPFASNDMKSVYTFQTSGTTGQKLVNVGIR
jgi:hypothetical protein